MSKQKCALSTCDKKFEKSEKKKYCSNSCRVRASQIREKVPELSKEDSQKVAKYLEQHGIGISDLINGLNKRSFSILIPNNSKKEPPKVDYIPKKEPQVSNFLKKRQADKNNIK